MPKGKAGKIELIQRTLTAENLRFDIFFDHIRQDDGQEVLRYLVVAPKVKTENLVTGVSVLPVFNGKIGLVRVYRHAVGCFLWELPRGFVDEGESAFTSAMRELEEEAGLTCEPDNFKYIGTITPEAGTLAARVKLYVAKECTEKPGFVMEEFGHDEFRLFSLEEMDQMVTKEEIQDPGTLIAYYRYIQMKEK